MIRPIFKDPISESIVLHCLLLLALCSAMIYRDRIAPTENIEVLISDRTETSSRSLTRDLKPSPLTTDNKLKKSASPNITLKDLGMKMSYSMADNGEDAFRDRNRSQLPTLLSELQPKPEVHREGTKANTVESPYFSYFRRVQAQLDRTWHPLLYKHLRDLEEQQRPLPPSSEFLTGALITLSTDGSIDRIQLLKESGHHELDQTAIEALHQSAPYPNPPEGLIGKDGKVQIRWNFLVKT